MTAWARTSGVSLSLSLALTWLAGGCDGEQQIVGRQCEVEGCRGPERPFDGCPWRWAPGPVSVDGDINVCWIGSVGFPASTDGGPPGDLYVTAMEATLSLPGHHLDVRLVDEADFNREEYPDNVPMMHACAALWRDKSPSPLMTSAYNPEDATVRWNLSDAPLRVSPTQRVMADLHYVGGPDRAFFEFVMACQQERPPVITQGFALTREEGSPVPILPGRRQTLCATCEFGVPGELRRLFRPTHLIEGFLVTLNGTTPLWGPQGSCRSGHEDWWCEFEQPLHIGELDELSWQCTYENTGDSTVEVGQDSGDDCSLLGVFSTEESATPKCVTRRVSPGCDG